MILHDMVVPSRVARHKAGNVAQSARAQTLISELNQFAELSRRFLTDNSKTVIANAVGAFNEQYKELRAKAFLELGMNLPDDLLEYQEASFHSGYGYMKDGELDYRKRTDTLTTLAKTPKASMSQIRELTDKFQFVIMPYMYFNPSALPKDYYDKQAIENFISAAYDKRIQLRPYVVSPIQYYSVENHAKAENADLPLYSNVHQSTLTTIALNIPMFRSILNTLAELQNRVDNIDNQIKSIKTNMQSMQVQLDRIAKQVEIAVMRMIEAEAKARQIEAKLEAMTLRVLDPMLIALPRDVSLDAYQGDVIIGPCWGPDFDPELLKILGIKGSKPGMITNEINQLYR